jgi:uncharacterized protein YegL/Flp pilus assembly protein TadD
MMSWAQSSSEIAHRDRLAASLATVGVAGAAVLAVAGAPPWLAILVAIVGFVTALARLALEVARQRAESREAWNVLLRRPPEPVAELVASAGFYELGVETEAGEALAALGRSDDRHAPYVARDADAELQARLLAASVGDKAELIVLSGPAKAGKSRSLAEVAARLPDAWLLAPRTAAGLAALARGQPPREVRTATSLVWLDDIEPFVQPGDQGLSPETLEALGAWPNPVIVLAAHGGKGVHLAGGDGTAFRDAISDLLRRYPPVRLRAELSDTEREHLERTSGPGAAAQVAAIGEFMIAAPRLVDRLEHDFTCPEGVAITRAAIDWRRCGLVRPISSTILGELYPHYLNGPADPERLRHGLYWATRPLYAHVALLQGREDEYQPYDYIASYWDRHGPPIPAAAWQAIIDRHATTEELASAVGRAAFDAGQLEWARRSFSAADERGDARGAFNHGVLLRKLQELDDAEAAYRRADERGDAAGASDLGVLLERRGDADAALAAYGRADERGDAGGAFNLGLLLAERGDLAGAEAAWRRADNRGDAGGAFRLGVELERRGDLDSAIVSYARADERGHAGGAFQLGVLLERSGDLDAAEAAYCRADERGDAGGASNLGALLERRGELSLAEAAYVRADERGHVSGAYNLGYILESRGDLTAAEQAYCRADARGHAAAASNLGVLLEKRGELVAAEAAFRRADARGHAGGAHNLRALMARRGEAQKAEASPRLLGASTQRQESEAMTFPDSSHQRLPIVLVVDTSASMKGDAIDQVNTFLARLAADVRSDVDLSLFVELALITFGHGEVAHWRGERRTTAGASPFVPGSELSVPVLSAAGPGSMVEAVDVAMRCLADFKTALRTKSLNYYRPHVWLISDGVPTDARARAAEASRQLPDTIRTAEEQGRFLFFALSPKPQASDGYAELERLAPDAHLSLPDFDPATVLQFVGASAEPAISRDEADDFKRRVAQTFAQRPLGES